MTRTEGDDTAFVGYFEAIPGVTPLTRDFDDVYLINCAAERLHTVLPSLRGTFRCGGSLVIRTLDYFGFGAFFHCGQIPASCAARIRLPS